MVPVPVLHATDIRIISNLFALDKLGAGVTVKILVGVSSFEIVAITRQCLQNPTAIRLLLVADDQATPSACSSWLSRDRFDTGGTN